MLIESLIAGSIWLGAEYMKTGGSDANKIQRICRKAGLYKKYDGKEDTMKLLRSKHEKQYSEYIFRIPEGLSFKDYVAKKDVIQDGLNNSQISLSDLRELNLTHDLKKQIELITNKEKGHRKEIEIEYDRVLKIRVYNKPLPAFIPYSDEILSQCKKWQVPIGYSRNGLVKHDFDRSNHIIVAGGTNYGKTNAVKGIITTLINNNPDHTNLLLIDLKGGLAFHRYRNAPQLKALAIDIESALEVLRYTKELMNQTMQCLFLHGHEDVKEAHISDRYFVVIDEAAELSSQGETDTEIKKLKRECENIITDIARRGRSSGFYLVYSTQYPTNETIRSQVRQNCDARLCMRLQTDEASRAVLDENGAEDLPKIQGRAIYKSDGKIIVQVPYIENQQIERMIQHENTDSGERK